MDYGVVSEKMPPVDIVLFWLGSVSDFCTKDILDLLTVGKNINNCL